MAGEPAARPPPCPRDRIGRTMASAAQIAANRRNALRSTGPRTAAGKAASSRNGLRHGLRARAAAVPGEDAQDFERFRAELRSALAPRDAREELLAETAVRAAWRQRRAWRAEAALFNRGPRVPPLRELMTLVGYEAAANRAFYRALSLLERGRSPRRTAKPPSRQDETRETLIPGERTQFSHAAPSPNPLAPLASWRLDEGRRLSRKPAKTRENPQKTMSDAPESPLERFP
jgi:hypothetical protein